MRHLVLALLGALFLPFAASAQMRIDVSGVGATQYPIAIARFASDGRAPQDVAAVVRGDLSRSGAFRIIEQAATCLLYTSPSPRDKRQSRMPSSA